MKDEENNKENSIDDIIDYSGSDNDMTEDEDYNEPEADISGGEDEFDDILTDDDDISDFNREPQDEDTEFEEFDIDTSPQDEENEADEAAEYDEELYPDEIEDDFAEQTSVDGELSDEEIFAGIKENNARKIKPGCIAAIAAAVLVIVAFFVINDGFIGSYKNNFQNNFASIFRNFIPNSVPEPAATKKPQTYKTEIKNTETISTVGATDAEFTPYREGFLFASANRLAYIDTDGKIVWDIKTAIVSPILSAEGNYILLAERGRRKVCLYSGKDLVYDTDDTDNILAANVSANGDAVLVTDKSSYKGGISVYNKSGDQIYSWVSGSDAVISADMSSSSRRIAVALLNTEQSAKSTIQFFDINLEKSYAQVNADDTVIYNLHFSGNTLTAFGDNRVMVMGDNGNVQGDLNLSDSTLNHCAMDDDGNKLLSLDDGTSPMLVLCKKNGAKKDTMTISSIAGHIDLKGSNVLYSIGRDIYFGKMNAKNITKYTASMDIKKLMLIKDNTMVIVYSNSVEVVKI